MNFKQWKFGLFVAIITGLATAFAGGMIFPEATYKQLAIVLCGSIGKDILLFLAQHPADSVSFDTSRIIRAPDGTVTNQKSTLTVTQPQPNDNKT